MSDNNTDIANVYKVTTSIRPDQWGASVNGSVLDCQDCERSVTCVRIVGQAEGTSETIAVKLQYSTDNSSWTDWSGATMTTTTAGAGHDTEVKTFFDRPARYVRAVGTIGGTSPDIDYSVVLMCRKKSY